MSVVHLPSPRYLIEGASQDGLHTILTEASDQSRHHGRTLKLVDGFD